MVNGDRWKPEEMSTSKAAAAGSSDSVFYAALSEVDLVAVGRNKTTIAVVFGWLVGWSVGIVTLR